MHSKSITDLAPWLGDRPSTIEQWHDVHLLSVKSDRLQRWHYPGLILIGDAAHVMSPVFGVGINYAIADAVELVNTAVDSLLRGEVAETALAEVQRLRELPTGSFSACRRRSRNDRQARARRQGVDLPESQS
jgi:2-polyprenyl-6-methoxyphenol hydroxylase-like FAD-dependent oxidoreductase